MIGALARVPALRLARTPRAWLPMLGWVLVGLGLALLARAQRAPNGADHVLLGAFGALVVPLLAYAAVAAALGSQSLASSVAPLVTFGAPPARAATITVIFAMGIAALPAAILGAIVARLAHGVDDPPAARDALVSAYVGALGAASYAAYFSMGASLGRRGGGRAVLLVVDWLLGSNQTALALVTPRGHLRNLLGGAPPFGLDERGSALALAAIGAVCALIAIRRSRRA